jgi:hypothetical protein
LQEQEFTLGFHPSALVWHRRRSSVRRYWRQQQGYGKAEALLERKWPERYNRRGHVTWSGRLYDRASASRVRPSRIYHGIWGTGAFQPEEATESVLAELSRTPEWYLAVGVLAVLTTLSAASDGLVVCAVLLCVGIAVPAAYAGIAGARAQLGRHGRGVRGAGLRGLVACLHLAQPAARLAGRLSLGLAPWRRSRGCGVALPRCRRVTRWFERWQPAEQRVGRIEAAARRSGGRIVRGGPYDRWDLEVLGGAAGGARMLVAVEEHGRGRQLVRCRIWPVVPALVVRTALGLAALAACAARAAQMFAAGAVLAVLMLLVACAVWECAIATAGALAALEDSDKVRGRAGRRALLGLRLLDAGLEDG